MYFIYIHMIYTFIQAYDIIYAHDLQVTRKETLPAFCVILAWACICLYIYIYSYTYILEYI